MRSGNGGTVVLGLQSQEPPPLPTLLELSFLRDIKYNE